MPLTTRGDLIRGMTEVYTGLHAVTIHIRDIQRAREFYRDVLELKELKFDEKANRAVFAIPGSSTMLSMHIQGPGEEGREPGTVSGVVFSHPDPAAACSEIKRRGGTVTLEPTLVELPGARFFRAAFADPDGNEFLISNRSD
jgi:catechol 2,3-dioxygenase-like lactoylglutathione lyase family enzyme